MPKWVKTVFLRILPKYLFMRRPLGETEESFRRVSSRRNSMCYRARILLLSIILWDDTTGLAINYHEHRVSQDLSNAVVSSAAGGRRVCNDRLQQLYYTPAVLKAFENVCFIAELLKKKDRDDKVRH